MLAILLAAGALAPAATLVVPGVSLGQLKIGAPGATLVKFGRPYSGDAAMQKSWSTWLGKGNARLDVYTVVLVDRPVIRWIRATSPSFRTAKGFGPGVSETKMRRAFPRAQDVTSYRPPEGGPPIHVFDDVRSGVDFEVRRGVCVAIGVHAKGRATTSEGLPLIEYLKQPLQKM